MLETLLHQIVRNVGYTALYYLVVVLAFSVLWLSWRWGPRRRAALQNRPVGGAQIGREMLISVGAVVAAGSVLPILFTLGFGNHTRFYPRVEQYGWPYFVLSIFLMMVIQDTYFYWSHRLMHHPRLFRWFHRTHHKSTNINPWTTYSISPFEALGAMGAVVLTVLLIPVTGLALLTFSWINTAYAVYTHLGYELYPRGMATHWLGRWINTSVAHNTHHARNRYNFSWYFLFWDRSMGTLDPDYERRYQAAFAEKIPCTNVTPVVT